jgi:flavin-dependent dehydrogenase
VPDDGRDHLSDRLVSERYDVLVVGGGPAGCAAAATAARAGARVVILDSATGSARVGEGAAPGTPRLIDEIFGSAGAIDGDAHVACPAIVFAWGAGPPSVTDHMLNPLGVGWNLDRARFDADLRAACEGLGVEVVSGVRASRPQLEGEGRTAGVVIDATGRGARVARLMGARKQHLDRLVALWAIWSVGPDDSSAATHVEAVRDGWWYSALLPRSRRIVVLLTDADLLPRARRARLELSSSATRLELIGALLDASAAPEIVVGPSLTSARSGWLDRFSGTRWLAAGDAAVTYDPLSGRGITCALLTGRSAGEAAVAVLDGDEAASERHRDLIASLIDNTLTERLATYRAEARWPDGPFWARRRADA